MANKVYETATITLFDGREIYLIPLKLKYLREFMVQFDNVKSAHGDHEAIDELVKCAAIAMKQYCPELSTVEKLEDNVDMMTVYRIINIAAGIKVDPNEQEEVKQQATESGSTWEDLDLVKLESEIFLLGIWKDYEDLERSMSMPEIITTLSSKRDLDYEEKKFLAAVQGIDLDEESGKKEVDPWEAMKARVFSGGKTDNPDDILAYQGVTAAKAGFGIGMGLDYEDNR